MQAMVINIKTKNLTSFQLTPFELSASQESSKWEEKTLKNYLANG